MSGERLEQPAKHHCNRRNGRCDQGGDDDSRRRRNWPHAVDQGQQPDTDQAGDERQEEKQVGDMCGGDSLSQRLRIGPGNDDGGNGDYLRSDRD